MPTRRDRPSPVLIWAGLLTLYVVWGSTYLGIAVAIETIPPFLMAGSRFAVAGLVMLAAALLVGRSLGPITWPTRREWRDSAIVGALLMGGGMGMVALGEETVPSGIAALLIAMMPLWVAVLGRLFFRERLPRLAVAGIVIGLAGVGILVGPSANAAESFDPGGILALIVSPISWSSGSLYSAHRARLPNNPLVATGLQMLTGSVVLGVMAVLRGEHLAFRIEAVTVESLLGWTYLIFIGSLVAFTAYVWLLRVAPLPLIATYAYVNPVVAVALGAVVLGETVTQRTLVAGAVIVFAVALIITARSRMSPAAGSDDVPERAAAPPKRESEPEPA
jgi:drug/metabolite transporter (DMT)-like permease